MLVSQRLPDGSTSSGTGTVVLLHPADRLALVLTCRHVVGSARGPILVTFATGERYEGVFLAADERADLAALAIAPRGDHAVACVPLAATSARPGEAVAAAGYPLGRGPCPRSGHVLGLAGTTAAGVAVLRADFAVQQGESGSGLIRTSDQALVGVVWGSDGSSTAATGVDDVHRFLEERCHRWFPQLRRPAAVTPATPSREPAPAPPAPAVPPAEVVALRREVDRLRNELAELRQRSPPAGPPGPKGDPGPPGPAADAGALLQEIAGLKAQVQALSRKLNNLSGSIRVKVEPVPSR